MKINFLAVTVASVAVLSGAWIASKPGKPPDKITPTALAPKVRQPDQPLFVESEEVIRMVPDDWKLRFAKSPSAVNRSTQADILRLSGDLQEMLAAGNDPKGEDAIVYADAIRTLLESSGED